MSTQRHIIKRQVIELQIQHAAEAQPLQAEVSRIYRQRIVPLLDKYCSALSQPDRLYRIETLELDLGAIDPKRLEEDFVAKFRQALPQALAQQIETQERAANGQGQSTKVKSQLELLAFFARTSSLPWWADATRPQLLQDCLQYLVETAPEQLRRLLRDLVREQSALLRLVAHYDDGLLASLAQVLTPALKNIELQNLFWALPQTRAATGRLPTQLRRSLWVKILTMAGLTDEPFLTAELLYQAVLVRVAIELGTTYNSLVSEIHQVLLVGRERGGGELVRVLERLYQKRQGAGQDLADLPAIADRPLTAGLPNLVRRLPSPLQDELLAALKGMESDPALGATASPAEPAHILELFEDQSVAEMVRSLIPQLPSSLQEELLATLNKMESDLALGATASPAEKTARILKQFEDQSVAEMVRSLVSQLPSSLQEELLAALNKMESDPALGTTASLAELQRILSLLQLGLLDTEKKLSPVDGLELARRRREKLSESANKAVIDLSFSQADELYIGNAGLVILWPFLGHFFERLDLLAAQRFKDTAAQQRAVGLLQYLASGEVSFPEYLLPLNKVLCGVELTELFDFGPTLSEAEAEEGENLLTAVIAQAPILRDMSVAGFRGTFLLRQGVLSTRDGAWLLRVERETYDIVLDRFPWGWEWLKLPWMAAPLRVEW